MAIGVPKKFTPVDHCTRKYDEFLDSRNLLRRKAEEFLIRVEKEYRHDQPRQKYAEELVRKLYRDWSQVRPYTGKGKIGFDPFKQANEEFKLSQWANVGQNALHAALLDCGEKFVFVHTLYEKLLPAEQQQAIPGRLKP